MAEFDSPGLQSDYALKLSSYRRQEGQTTAQFLHELQQLAEHAYPDWDHEPPKGIVKAHFINGLDSELWTQLMLQAPEDEALEDLERRTRRIEQVRGSSSTSTSSVGRMEAGPTIEQQVAELRDQLSTVTASMAELQAGVGRLTFGTGQRGARSRGVYRGSARSGLEDVGQRQPRLVGAIVAVLVDILQGTVALCSQTREGCAFDVGSLDTMPETAE